MAGPYTSIAISGYDASPPSDDASQTETNRVKWATVKTKLGNPVKTLAEDINTALDALFNGSSTSSTFTFDGSGGTSSAVTLTWQKIGNWVTLNIPAVSATTGTGSTTLSSNTAIAAAARPVTTQAARVSHITNNGATVGPSGTITITSAGVLAITRDSVATAFTNTASGGIAVNMSFTYFVG